MEPVEFPQQTHVLAKDQPQYRPLPVHIDQTDESIPMTCCFELSDEEIAEMAATKKLWYTQCTFGNNFQPVRLSTQNPFTQQNVEHAQERSIAENSHTGENQG